MAKVTMEFDLDSLGRELAQWSYEDLLELLKVVDETKGEWDFIGTHLKPWVDEQHRQMIKEETESLAERTEKCQRSAEYPDIWIHVDPHRGCILR